MIRPAESLEVYKQKQNILFASESVEHRRFKVTWQDCGCIQTSARPSARVERMNGQVLGSMHERVLGSMHSRVHVSGIHTDWMGARLDGSWGSVRIFVLHDSDGRAARLVVVDDLVGTRPRFGRDARIGCTRAKLYGHDWAMWLVYRNVHMQLKVKGMQLKVKGMQLKVKMQKNIGERGSTRAIYIHSLLL